MRVLLVNAYPVGNKRGLERFDKFRQHVLRVVKELEKTEVTDVELVVSLDIYYEFSLSSTFTPVH